MTLAASSAWDILTPWTLLSYRGPGRVLTLRRAWLSLLSVLYDPHRSGVFLQTRKSVFLMEIKDKNRPQYQAWWPTPVILALRSGGRRIRSSRPAWIT